MPQILMMNIGFAGERTQGGSSIGSAHQRFTDKKSVEASFAEQVDIGMRVNAAFGHADRARRHEVTQAQGSIERDFERFEIAIVDTDDFRARIDGFRELLLVVYFDKRGEMQRCRKLAEALEFRYLENRGDQEDGIGSVSGGFKDLKTIYREIFA